MNRASSLLFLLFTTISQSFFVPHLLSGAVSCGLLGTTQSLEKKITEELPEAYQILEIFSLLDIPLDGNSTDEIIKSANTYAQKNFLRVGERWDDQLMTEIQTRMIKLKNPLLRSLKKIGMVGPRYPLQYTYDYALIMGALKSSVFLRLGFLKELCDKGYSFGKIVLLGSERPLRDEEKVGLPQEIKTEAEMILYVFETIFGHNDVLLINSPMKEINGKLIRPNTDDTLYDFFGCAPQGGTGLVISHNPYIPRQTKVAQRILSKPRFVIEGAGADSSSNNEVEDKAILILMDEFARLLYELSKNVAKS